MLLEHLVQYQEIGMLHLNEVCLQEVYFEMQHPQVLIIKKYCEEKFFTLFMQIILNLMVLQNQNHEWFPLLFLYVQILKEVLE